MTQQREHFRIHYPQSERPLLMVSGLEFQVIDLSESGARVLKKSLPGAEHPRQEIRLVFPDGGHFTTIASFVRRHADTVAIQFEKLVPFGRILAEQRRLRQQFAHLE